MARFTVYAKTRKMGSRCEADIEVPDEELEGLSEDERDVKIQKHALDAAFGLELVEIGWEEAKR